MKKFEIKRGKKWYRGHVAIEFNYNLAWLLLPFIILIYLIKYAFQALAWVVEKVIDGIWWLLKKFWIAIVAIWMWLKGLFNHKPTQPKEQKENKKFNWWWIIIPLLIVLGFLSFRSCDGGEPKPVAYDYEVVEDAYEASWDDVVVCRAYLDNVQGNAKGSVPRALVGFKFIDGKKASEFNFSDKTYEESLKIISESWKPFVMENVKVNLNQQQMTVVILTAMRMGDKRFKNSTFLKKLNAGDFEGAANWFVLEDSKGQIMKTGKEPKQYFRVLRFMWEGWVTPEEIAEFPIWSYLKLDPEKDYTPEEMIKVMASGTTPTPRTALGLE